MNACSLQCADPESKLHKAIKDPAPVQMLIHAAEYSRVQSRPVNWGVWGYKCQKSRDLVEWGAISWTEAVSSDEDWANSGIIVMSILGNFGIHVPKQRTSWKFQLWKQRQREKHKGILQLEGRNDYTLTNIAVQCGDVSVDDQKWRG